MREGKKHPFAINVWRWGLLILLLVLWEIGARLKWIDPFFFSSPLEIARTAVIKWQGGTLWRDIAYTGASTLLGFVLGTVIGSVVGLLFWFSRPVAQVAEPWMIVLNALPKLALAPVLVIWFGIGFLSKVILAFLMTVVVAAMSAYSGVRTADPALETLMVSLGARRMQIFTRLIVPSAMPSIITGLRSTSRWRWRGRLSASLLHQTAGWGV